mmetsp:Transcript_19023/g.45917  ORF Transcript_19023/g.45917 Transcript_19023/m.45917 type:complete len:320 (-) Transcript_19023:7321-8280(-)
MVPVRLWGGIHGGRLGVPQERRDLHGGCQGVLLVRGLVEPDPRLGGLAQRGPLRQGQQVRAAPGRPRRGLRDIHLLWAGVLLLDDPRRRRHHPARAQRLHLRVSPPGRRARRRAEADAGGGLFLPRRRRPPLLGGGQPHRAPGRGIDGRRDPGHHGVHSGGGSREKLQVARHVQRPLLRAFLLLGVRRRPYRDPLRPRPPRLGRVTDLPERQLWQLDAARLRESPEHRGPGRAGAEQRQPVCHVVHTRGINGRQEVGVGGVRPAVHWQHGRNQQAQGGVQESDQRTVPQDLSLDLLLAPLHPRGSPRLRVAVHYRGAGL